MDEATKALFDSWNALSDEERLQATMALGGGSNLAAAWEAGVPVDYDFEDPRATAEPVSIAEA